MSSKQLSHQVPSVDEIHSVLATMGPTNKYETVRIRSVSVMIRASSVRRRENDRLDFDIVQIETTPAASGIGTQFVVNLIQAAYAIGRGVFLEQTITVASRAWAKKLVRENLMRPWSLEDNFISVCPTHATVQD
jgi:hypothetical protein